MSKTWDCVIDEQVVAVKRILKPGSFHCNAGLLRVEVVDVCDKQGYNGVAVRIGGCVDSSTFTVQAGTARVLSEFFAEVAAILEDRK